ncbi:hypothetical protein DZF91_22215 [Actinomadura logoneensis]|uniref:Uncharacterized protein n=1 Tax=Actinomadura logoneensis TaxID=2293572 RepID=A0A372JHZ4_9ACTN|nr:hypothetical protein [Actinomadura logoneensis]RFU39474.1 hypothetical protein DZF91_22215 [Actinomadura logoneensis]
MRFLDGGGRRWRLGRRYLPWRPRPHPFLARHVDLISDFDDPISAAINMTLTLLVLPFAIWLCLSWALALFLTPFVTAGRILFRRPWPVVAFQAEGSWEYLEYARSWRAAGRLIQQARRELTVSGNAPSLRRGST